MFTNNLFVILISVSVISGICCWYQDYNYRKNISFVNLDSVSHSNHDVEYYFNSLELQTEGKIQQNCFDVEFTLHNNTKLDFWLEQGCGLSRTTYWIRIPFFQVGVVTTVFMYFGSFLNITRSIQPGLEWNNRFGFMRDASCGDDFTFMSEMESYFGLGSSVEDYSSTLGSDTHDHSQDGKTVYLTPAIGLCNNPCTYKSNDYQAGVYIFCSTHDHNVNLGSGSSTTTSSSFPSKYINYVFCKASTIHDQFFGLIPSGSIVMFDHMTPISSWTDGGDVNSQYCYVRGSSTGIVNSITSTGNHNHQLDFTGRSFVAGPSANCNYGYFPNPANDKLSTYGHEHAMPTCISNSKENVPPFYYLNFRKSEQNTHFVEEMITFQYCGSSENCTHPPLGWERYSDLDNKFPRGATSSLKTSSSVGHIHSFSGCETGGDTSGDSSNAGGGYCVCGEHHIHDYDGGVDVHTKVIYPKYRKTIFIKRKKTSLFGFVDDQPTVAYGDMCSINETNLVCSGHGNCTTFSTLSVSCVCNDHYFGQYCEINECYGYLSNDTSSINMCSGHGNCIDYNNCSCFDNYTHPPINLLNSNNEYNCSFYKCFDYWYNDDDNVCSRHGNCISAHNCSCFENYTESSDCSLWKCFNKYNTDLSDVCSGYGDCLGFDNCRCRSESYSVINCEIFNCYTIPSNNISSCGSHGTCTDTNICTCNSGYYTKNNPIESYSDLCSHFDCFGTKKDSDFVCTNKRGECLSPNYCSCGDYDGDYCQTFSCGVFDYKLPQTCSGKGKCKSPNKCECKTGFSGSLCETNDMLLTIMTPVLGSFGIFIFFVVFVLFCCFVCSVITCICIVIFGVFVIFGFIIIVSFQKLKMLKFEKLDNLDLILEEQKAEKDVSIAHIKINKKLFHIPYEEIKISKIIGEGGSSSVVYLARWRNQAVAFKCFKTRLICSNQDSFDEFEKEVQVMSSVSHPNVVHFFGCSLKPPRVGILMEFCVKGETLQFIIKYEEKNKKRYPLQERIRIIEEISFAMDFLHSRSIIHRDLKCENVLLDKSEKCKLMDFGLAKISKRLSQQKTKRIGTSFYMAPEVVLGDRMYDEKCDVFSFGIMIWILITSDPLPYGEESSGYNIEMKVAQDENFRPAKSRMIYYLPKKYHWVMDIAEQCWNVDSKKRPSFGEISETFITKKKKIGKEEEEEEDSRSFEEEEEEDKEEEGEDGELELFKKKVFEMEKRMKYLEEKNKELEEINKKLMKKNSKL